MKYKILKEFSIEIDEDKLPIYNEICVAILIAFTDAFCACFSNKFKFHEIQSKGIFMGDIINSIEFSHLFEIKENHDRIEREIVSFVETLIYKYQGDIALWLIDNRANPFPRFFFKEIELVLSIRIKKTILDIFS